MNSSRRRNIFIGTSGWNYNHWKGIFYPESLSRKNWLEYYCRQLSTVEINNSFYRLPEKNTFQKWFQSTPSGFIFSVKASRYITHMKKLKDTKDSLKKFTDHVSELKEKLGPVLFQLPPNLKFNAERLESFLKELPDKIRFVMEFRNRTWWNNQVYGMLRKYNTGFCIFELGETLSPEIMSSDFVYIRLHGSGEKYKENYNENALKSWSEKIIHWAANNLDVYIYFDNDAHGYAVQNALQMREKITNKPGNQTLF